MKQRLAVIGNGMAGVFTVEQILKHNHDFEITIFGDETHVNYNRILLSSVLAGEKEMDDIVLNDIDWYKANDIQARLGLRIDKIDLAAKTIHSAQGCTTAFDKLLIATGSSPFLPPIDGIDKQGIFVFRTLDDAKHLLALSGAGVKAVVIGGGLLGLEAARGLQLQGCDVTVIHLGTHLMDRQLDFTGGQFLQRKLASLGITVLCRASTAAFTGEGHVEGVRLSDGLVLDANLVVVAAGIKPNAALAKLAGLDVNRGIVVNEYLETSHPDVFAVGECTEFNGQLFGLVAPLWEQGKVLAATLTGNRGPVFTGYTPATKLKIMGADVFSAGDFNDQREGVECVRLEDPALGIYKKLILRENKLEGVILVGDASDDHRFMAWLRNGTDLTDQRRHLLSPATSEGPGEDAAALPDSHTICGCNGVSKGAIIDAVHTHGVCTLAQLKDKTRAATGCGSCTGLCQSLLKAVAPDYSEEKAKVLCDCVPFPQDQLREIIRSQKLRGVQELLDIYGNGIGCEVCKPALSYLVDVVWQGEHNEDRSARFINDRVHANIQKDGTFSVIPRMRGGVTTPAELRKIADVAEKYNVPLVKVTGSQRIDLLGVKKQDLPNIWEDLGMRSGQGYTKGVRMVKTCVGSTFCRFGTQDAITTGIELERRLEDLFTPHKTKLAVVGCPRNCAEATVKDIGLIGQEGSWQLVVGGAAGKGVRKADLLITVETTEEALTAAQLFFQYYREHGVYLERTYDFVERLGIEKVRRETVYAVDAVKQGLLDRLQRSKDRATDAWLERYNPRPFQFSSIEVESNELVQIEIEEKAHV
ncbi:MAG TPA: nitrite reductase large subunit NirB [Bryobacteraceae bacterium]|nr:nitrite reductase large subunit NirB [Bryobacteraceae bacterium]